MTEGSEDTLEKRPVRRDYLKALLRHRWYLIAPLLVCGTVGAIVTQFWPALYRSEAMIIVEQQKVPEQYVTPNVVANLQTRLDAMKQQILSRTRLERMIESFGLYARERSHLVMDDVIDKMRNAIEVTLVPTPGRQGEVTGFRIAYSSDQAYTAQRITNELVSQFIEESLRQRAQQSENTTQFFESELDDARHQLEGQEQMLREYKMKFLGELPEQEQGSLQILGSLQAQLYTAGGALERAEQQRTYLQSMREQYRALSDPGLNTKMGGSVVPGDSRNGQGTSGIDTQLLTLQSQLAEASAKFGPMHPEVRSLTNQIADLERVRKSMEANAAKAAKTAAAAAASGVVVTGNRAEDINLAETSSRLKAIDVEIGTHKANIAKLETQIRELQDHLKMIPVREQQLADITRSSENARAQYQSLLQKKLQSELANNLEKRQQGEQFRILDSASLPQKPQGKTKILAAGWVIGLLLGACIVVALEIIHPCINGEADVDLSESIRVFAIPLIESPAEVSRRKWLRCVEVATAGILLLSSLGSSVHTYLQR
jgi:polysaccharide chain length determinant protein (PEP-CTERM system associated)